MGNHKIIIDLVPFSKEFITSDAIRSIRPGYGISPKHFDEIINRKLTMDVDKHTPVTFEVIEDIDR